VLERLGWRFIRIRGSEFYCDRASTMQRVEQELERMGVRPRGRFFSDTNLQSTPPSSLAEEIIREAEGIKAEIRATAAPANAPLAWDTSDDSTLPGLLSSASSFPSGAKVAPIPSTRPYGQKVPSSSSCTAVHPPSPPRYASPTRSLEHDHSRAAARLTEPDLLELRARLIEERERSRTLCESLRTTCSEIRGLLPHEPEAIWYHQEDVMACLSELENVRARQSRAGAMLRAVEDALAKLDVGRYGMCESCNLPIGLDRLQALPWARLCIACQTRAEQEGQ
jgi:RNA polymerase-binding transcription factor DksA